MDQAKIADDMLAYRKLNATFEKSIQSKSPQMSFNFYDGPPFASGDPHYGHLLASSIKDTVARYMTMRGYRVPRIRGRDCHGMPAESFVEKKLGLNGKKDIEALGVQQFVEACRQSVRQVNDNRHRFVDHIGRRVDIDHAYYTMDLDFMESVVNCFATMYRDNLIYKGFKIQGYCPSCATGLSNRDILEGYQMRNDPTAIVKFPLIQAASRSRDAIRESDGEQFARDDLGFVQYVICVIQDSQGRILSFYNNLHNSRQYVAGHVDSGETIQQAALREVQEELGVTGEIISNLGALRWSRKGNICVHHYIHIRLHGDPINAEPHKHSQMEYVQIVDADNDLGRGYQVNNLIITDVDDIYNFKDLVGYQVLIHKLPKDKNLTGPMNFLAWTTTPWTLPSNMFLAVGPEIMYAQVYDFSTQEYYILAESLLHNVYKNQSDYIIITRCKGSELVGIKYKPLFDYYHQSDFDPKYTQQVHQVLAGDFVTTSDGVGIVHIAPAFGEDDYQISAQMLGHDTVSEWLMLPLNQYGEFTDQVSDFAGLKAHDTNKAIIEYLKNHHRIVKIDQISHSYPHCRRCDTPLIYKAITSRFVKEQQLAPDNIVQAQSLNFVPESIKQRFINGLESAPDWNISRNRYRGCPLPVREAQTSDPTPIDKKNIVVGSLEELYQHSKTGSRNITKFVFVRHGKTDYNMKSTDDGYIHDSLGKAVLTDVGTQQAQDLISKMTYDPKSIVYLSPLPRVIQTAAPRIQKYFGFDIINSTRYQEVYELYKQYRHDGSLTDLAKIRQASYEIHPNIIIDFRLGEEYFPDYQDRTLLFNNIKRNDESLGGGTSTQFNYEKNASLITDIARQYPTQTIILFGHGSNGLMIKKYFQDFDHDTNMHAYTPHNATPIAYYYDNSRCASVDLHLPYVDQYRFEYDGIKYHRVPEVLDCWFESGAMPFGQFHTLRNANTTADEFQKSFAQYPADFIAEGLDQTRGWFRALHIVGNAMMGSNSYRNVVVNGLILAEDGKKMSKKLKNYPDPRELLNNYGADAFRLYTLGSPVVKAEPLKFVEKGVEQMLKDVILPLHNVVRFFQMYADIDTYQHSGTEIYFMRHAKCVQGDIVDRPLSQEGFQQLQSDQFKESLIAINPDIILYSPTTRTTQTAQSCSQILKDCCNKDVLMIQEERLLEGSLRAEMDQGNLDNIIQSSDQHKTKLQDLLSDSYTQYPGKKILLVSHNVTLCTLWSLMTQTSIQSMIQLNPNDKKHYYIQNNYNIDPAAIIKLPTHPISNELDQHILAELHQTIDYVSNHMANYNLDDAVKTATAFVDVLSNRYIRRSRRRFWASGLEGDKLSAYHTLYEVITTYLKLLAPIIPFNTEYLWQQIKQYEKNWNQTSIHLTSYPQASSIYINQKLLEEITKVRKIISMTLYLRAKNQIKIKQPLPRLEIKIS